jgi:hypothetical protein
MLVDKPARHYAEWTKKEEAKLLKEYRTMTVRVIAGRHERTPGAIRAKLAQLRRDAARRRAWLEPQPAPEMQPIAWPYTGPFLVQTVDRQWATLSALQTMQLMYEGAAVQVLRPDNAAFS